MAPEEMAAFLRDQRVVVCATNGVRGWPHLMPLWYVVRGEELWAWTYAKSQKVRNLERDVRATLQVETGEQYHELRGVMIEAETTLHRDLEVVSDFGLELFRRYASDESANGDDGPGGGGSGADAAPADPQYLEVLRTQATKRVALQFRPLRVASWDHGKLGGVY